MDLSRSEELYKKACEVIPGGVSRHTVFQKPHPQYAAKASGCYVTDIDGIERIDFANNMAALIHGHAHPLIIQAVIEQLHRGTAYTMATEAEVAFATLLTNRISGLEKVRFTNSGTEAVMAMMKAARAFTGRPKIAKCEGAYHGTYDFAEVSQTSNPINWGDLSRPNSVPLVFGTPQSVLNEMVVFPFNDIERTVAILDLHANQLAAVMIDPVPHRVGLLPGTVEFIEAVYNWTRRNGALLIFDEVVTLRVAYGGAQEKYPVRPDMTAMGKIIGGGFPVGALGGRSDVMKVFDPREAKVLFPHSGTFSANPITTTAGRVAMELFDKPAVDRLNALTRQAIIQIEEAVKVAAVPVSITGAGSMFRIHLSPSPPSTYREAYQPKEVTALIEELLQYMYHKEQIMMINTFACMMSTVMTQEEIDRLSDGLLNAFRHFKPKLNALYG
ncbi:MAG TPA: aspartate aminotransferase family protein [Bacteroidales bacterium]|nr:aspartate aminotransferase family protein [Bacteroidales bacterium]